MAFNHPLGTQAVADEWFANPGTAGGPGIAVLAVQDRKSALHALAEVAAQGEGPGSSVEGDSHFARFFRIFREGSGFPADGDLWKPARPVPTNPVVPGVGTSGGSPVTDPLAAAWGSVANASYAIILGLIQHYLLSPPALRAKFAQRAIMAEMVGHLSKAREGLSSRPHTSGGVDAAGVPFGLPTPINLPLDDAMRRQALASRYADAIAAVERLQAALGAGTPAAMKLDAWKMKFQQHAADL